jgi:hypothetical protein
MSALASQLAKTLGFSDPANVRPAQLILILAIRGLSKTFTPKFFEEEPITAAFAGSISAHARWVMPLYDEKDQQSRTISWGHYRKHRTSAGIGDGKGDKGGSASSKTKRPPGEPETGADFALVVRLDEDHVALAVFQAKNVATDHLDDKALRESKRYISVNLMRRSPVQGGKDVAVKKAQMVTLDDYGADLVNDLYNFCSASNHHQRFIPPEVPEKDWIHYLIYRDGAPLLVSMRDLLEHRKRQREALGDKTSYTVRFYRTSKGAFNELQSFEQLVNISVPKKAGNSSVPIVPGWLTLTLDEAEHLLPGLCSLTDVDVFVADEDRGAGSRKLKLDREIGHFHKETFSGDASIAQFMEAMRPEFTQKLQAKSQLNVATKKNSI